MDAVLPYASFVHAALRHLVRGALEHAATHGLPGDHHFYLTFRTGYPGVLLPARLKAQYPDEMTIVLQHQFWDLKLQDDAFTVGLSFNGVPASLTIPFAALIGFHDPAMRGNPFAEVALVLDKDRGFALRLPVDGAAPAGYEGQDAPEETSPPPAAEPAPEEAPQVVSLDAFRKRGPEKQK